MDHVTVDIFARNRGRGDYFRLSEDRGAGNIDRMYALN
jgi:hypothetical protein